MLEDEKQRHGGPYDRGAADNYYHRGFCPHYFVGATYHSDEISREDMTAQEIAEYKQGYEDNQASGNHKEW